MRNCAGQHNLDESLRSVMGEVKSLKKAFQKQQGQMDQPTDQMYRCGELQQTAVWLQLHLWHR